MGDELGVAWIRDVVKLLDPSGEPCQHRFEPGFGVDLARLLLLVRRRELTLSIGERIRCQFFGIRHQNRRLGALRETPEAEDVKSAALTMMAQTKREYQPPPTVNFLVA